MAKAVNKDKFTYEQDSRNFNQELRRFHDQRGTAFSSYPKIGGKEVDLYLLYSKVTGDGGYEKVNTEDRWEDLHSLFKLPVGCTNVSQVLKQIYSRYLFLYEKLHFFGEDPDRPEEEDEAVQHKSKTPIVAKVAMSYNYRQHLIPQSMRQSHCLSKNLRVANLYEKLEKSLLSGLPNEVDFALNVCTLLSNEGRHVLHLHKTKNMTLLLMAHVGVYEEGAGSLLEFHEEWKKHTGRNFIRFWLDCILDAEVRDLIYPGHAMGEADWDRDSRLLFNQGRELGISDAEGQRVMQLASLVQNLSFEQANQSYMASNILVFRFVLLCIYSKYAGLHQTGLDTMANICSRLILEPIDCWTTELVLKTITRCLLSADKQDILKGMEMLTNLCQVDANDAILSDNLEPRAYKAIIQQLLVADLQLLIHTLEVLYQLSELGEEATDRIAAIAESVDILMSLITVEAGSFGPGALQGIRVVEYTVAVTEPSQSQQSHQPVQLGPVAPNVSQAPLAAIAATPSPLQAIQLPSADAEALAMCATWVKCNFEGHPLCSVNKAEIYRVYVDCMQRHNFTIVNQADFMKAIKMVYPERMTVAHVQKTNGQTEIALRGLRRRPVLRQFPPPKEGRHKNAYNFLKQAEAVSNNTPRDSSPGPVYSPCLLQPQGPILPPLSPHVTPPPSPATPPLGRYISPQPSNNSSPYKLVSAAAPSPQTGQHNSMVRNLLVNQVNTKLHENQLKRRASSPPPIKAKAARSLSPSYEDNCHLEVCGNVERAQDIVRGEQVVHETRIERIENQCAANNNNNNNNASHGHARLNGHMNGPIRDAVASRPLDDRTNLSESLKAKKVQDGRLVNGVILENGDHDGKLLNGYLSNEDSNTAPSTSGDDQDELLMAINNISREELAESPSAPVVIKAVDNAPILNETNSDSQSIPGLVDEDTTDGFPGGDPVLKQPEKTVEESMDADDSDENSNTEAEENLAGELVNGDDEVEKTNGPVNIIGKQQSIEEKTTKKKKVPTATLR